MKSMTGYGRDQTSGGEWTIAVEANSVNRKQLEVAASLPRELMPLESRIRELVSSLVSRGRINLSITCKRNTEAGGSNAASVVDPEYAKACHGALKQLQTELGLTGDVSISTLVAIPGVLRTQAPEIDLEAVWIPLEASTRGALRALVTMREEEGARLANDLLGRLQIIRESVATIRELHPAVVEKYRKALQERVRKAGVEVELDDERMYKEVVLFADRCDISEELTRLESHHEQFAQWLTSDQPMGRSLDFLIQEVGRELNTLGAKANDATISRLIVTCKAELEKVREQVQNIE